MRPIRSALLFAAVLTAAGCSSKSDGGASPPPPSSAPTAAPAAPAGGGDPAAKAAEIFAQRCTPCHGPQGRGDGVASKGLTPPPRNFTDAAWQASVTDEHIEQIIHFGGAAVGKSPAMPGNPDLSDPAVLQALRAHIRAFSGK